MRSDHKGKVGKDVGVELKILRTLRSALGAGAWLRNRLLRQLPAESGGLAGSEGETRQTHASHSSSHRD